MDIWIRCSDGNAQRVWRALQRFGAPLTDVTLNNLKTPDAVFQIGVAPRRIDSLMSIDGVAFDDAGTTGRSPLWTRGNTLAKN